MRCKSYTTNKRRCKLEAILNGYCVRHNSKQLKLTRCIDCKKIVSFRAKRCRACDNSYRSGNK